MSALLRAVLDTNIWVSAVLYGGVPFRILEYWRDDRFAVICTAEVFAEIKDPLLEKAADFRVKLEDAEEWLEHLVSFAEHVSSSGAGKGAARDPDDDKFLDAAISGNATHLVTGDKDLLSLGRFESVTILTPRAFLDLLESDRQFAAE